MTRKIVGYYVAVSSDISNIENIVNDYIERGWQPKGELIFKPGQPESAPVHIQVMVKHEEGGDK